MADYSQYLNQVVRLPLSNFAEWKYNLRNIDGDDFERLKKKLIKLGMFDPLKVSVSGDLLGGNMRLRGCRVITKMSPEELARYINDSFDVKAINFIYRRIYPTIQPSQIPLAADATLAEAIQKDLSSPLTSVVYASNDSEKMEYNLADNGHDGYYDKERVANEMDQFDIDGDLLGLDFDSTDTLNDILDSIAPGMDSEQTDTTPDKEKEKWQVECPSCHHVFDPDEFVKKVPVQVLDTGSEI